MISLHKTKSVFLDISTKQPTKSVTEPRVLRVYDLCAVFPLLSGFGRMRAPAPRARVISTAFLPFAPLASSADPLCYLPFGEFVKIIFLVVYLP